MGINIFAGELLLQDVELEYTKLEYSKLDCNKHRGIDKKVDKALVSMIIDGVYVTSIDCATHRLKFLYKINNKNTYEVVRI